MFTRRDYSAFILAASLIAAGYILMAIDPADNGFGVTTLWIAPPLLLIGFLLPALGITGFENLRTVRFKWKGLSAKHLFGLFTFLSALFIYLLTVEPTASLWDCSEFIASSYKLQVPHTPGTPLALLLGRLFSMLSFGDPSRVAWSVNIMSCVFSALTVTLVYRIILHLGENLLTPKTTHSGCILVPASITGSLCLAFSDTFWFSAVEAETYGIASFFLMLLVWLILTGKDLPQVLRSRRLVLVFYLAGLAYCVHPMCLLALPILPFSWYNAGRKLNFKNTLVSLLAGMAIVLIINRFIAVGLFELAFSFDRFFVNQLHFPFYSGALILALLLLLLFARVVKQYPHRVSFAWATAFLLFGFLPYLMLFIRSNHSPPIDETNPENLPLIKAYMNRESYPSSPLLFGPYFDAKIEDIRVKKQMYFKAKNTYEASGTLPEYQYNARQTLLPRIYSTDPKHIETYRGWLELGATEKPGFSHNLNFLLTYQLGHMYLRYLMWNFAGRKSDVQNSDWLKPWQRLSKAPFENARNQYWMIPLLAGFMGAVMQFRKDRKGFISVAYFFLTTGIVLALYLNAPPNEPRERDYIYVGSYIAFCVWIGFGMISLGNALSKFRFGKLAGAWIMMSVPLWMLYQNYDDHDRSGRTFQVDNARNVLNSCAPNSILFTGGDNDTFPLWYLQEVEGFRTDVRVMVLSYMNTDWYINQLRNTYYDSGAFNLTLDENDYRQYGPNDVLYVQESIKHEIDFMQYLELLKKEHPALRNFARNGEPYHILPGRMLRLAVDYQSIPVANTSPAPRDHTQTEVLVTVTDQYVSKNALAIMDLIVSNGWQRPIHFNFTSMSTLGIDLTPYLRQEGPVYRLVRDKHEGKNIKINTTLAYKNLIEDADYNNLRDSTVHFSYEDHYARMLVPVRQSFNALAIAFLEEGNYDMAGKVLAEAVNKLYLKHLRPSYTNLQAAEILLELDRNDDAALLARSAFGYYFRQVKTDVDSGKADDVEKYLLTQSAELLASLGESEYMKRLEEL